MTGTNSWGTLAVIGLLAFGAYQCSRGDDADAVAHSGSPSTTSLPFSPSIDEDEIADRAREALAGSAYVDVGSPYGCTEDCSGHEAGFAWARDNDVEDASDCGGNSYSFIEGCEAYAENLDEAREQALSDAEADERY